MAIIKRIYLFVREKKWRKKDKNKSEEDDDVMNVYHTMEE